jgi:heptosyltransferase-2
MLLTHGVSSKKAQKDKHQVEYYLDLLRQLGWTAKSRDPLIHVPETSHLKISRLMAEMGINGHAFLLGLAPGAAFGKAKRWPARRFAEAGEKAAREWGARVVIFGSEGEKEICDEVVRFLSREPVNLCGKTSLSEAIALIDQCKLFLSNDSGLMHVAAALNIPTVAVFGSTDPLATGPRGPNSVFVRNPVACAPCLKPECHMDYRCLLGVTSDQVWEKMEQLWKKSQ